MPHQIAFQFVANPTLRFEIEKRSSPDALISTFRQHRRAGSVPQAGAERAFEREARYRYCWAGSTSSIVLSPTFSIEMISPSVGRHAIVISEISEVNQGCALSSFEKQHFGFVYSYRIRILWCWRPGGAATRKDEHREQRTSFHCHFLSNVSYHR